MGVITMTVQEFIKEMREISDEISNVDMQGAVWMIVIKKQSLGGKIIKYIDGGTIRTETVIHGKIVHRQKCTMKSLGYGNLAEYMDDVLRLGFEIVKTGK